MMHMVVKPTTRRAAHFGATRRGSALSGAFERFEEKAPRP